MTWPRRCAVMVSAFAALAVVLAMVGVFGILAYSVQQRTRDFGVRRALGATSKDMLNLVVRDALKVIATGAAIGLIASAVLGRVIVSMLFGVQPLAGAVLAMSALLVWRHRQNIRRLAAGTESKLGASKPTPPPDPNAA